MWQHITNNISVKQYFEKILNFRFLKTRQSDVPWTTKIQELFHPCHRWISSDYIFRIKCLTREVQGINTRIVTHVFYQSHKNTQNKFLISCQHFNNFHTSKNIHLYQKISCNEITHPILFYPQTSNL